MIRSSFFLVLGLAGLGVVGWSLVRGGHCCCTGCDSEPGAAEPSASVAASVEPAQLDLSAPARLEVEEFAVPEPVSAGPLAPGPAHGVCCATIAQGTPLVQTNVSAAPRCSAKDMFAAKRAQLELCQQKTAGPGELAAAKLEKAKAAQLAKCGALDPALAAKLQHAGQTASVAPPQPNTKSALVESVRFAPVK